MGNDLKNYQYIICDADHNALLIDPLDLGQIRELVREQKLHVQGILLTHEHHDHADAAEPLQREWKIPVYSSAVNESLVRAKITPVAGGAQIKAGKELQVRAIDTPGHTAGHIAFEIQGFFFSGDCLFHGGCGHCRSANASVNEHYRTFTERLAKLAGDLILMPGHYYARNNLDFCLHVEPDNARSAQLRARLGTDADEMAHQTTLKQEREYNPFFRLQNAALRARISELTGRNLTDATDLAIFTELRQLRNNW